MRRKKHFSYVTKKGTSDKYYLRYLIYFDVLPRSITYEANADKNGNSRIKRKETKCKILKIQNGMQSWHIWQWNDEITDNDKITNMYSYIQNLKNDKSDFLIEDYHSKDERLIPVIYHPARDSNPIDKIDEPNYLEEIHCYPENNKITVTLVYAGERLRQHWFLHPIYKIIRMFGYQRTKDVESFHLLIDDKKIIKIDFPGIYSKDNNIYSDNIHNDAIVDVMQYFDSKQHPTIFVNTANHAMAEYDTNPTRWKIEYLVWDDECPLFFGNEKREKIEERLKSLNYKIRT